MAVQKDITFKNLDGEEITETWYFQIDEADAVDLDLAYLDDPATYLKEIFETRNNRALLELWRELLWVAAGKRVGNKLMKSPEIQDDFKYGGAYKQLFSEIISSDDAGVDFFTNIMPESVQAKVREEVNKTYTPEQMLAMTPEEWDRVFGTDESKWDRDTLIIAMQRRNVANHHKKFPDVA